MPPAETTTNTGQDAGQIDNQPDLQPNDDDGLYVRVRRDMYEHLAEDGDFNKVIHMAKQYRDAESSGLTAVGQLLADEGYDPHGFISAYRTADTSTQEPTQPPAAPVPAQGQDGEWVSPAQMQQAMAQVREEVIQEARNASQETLQTDRQQAEYQQAQAAQESAITATLDGMGYTGEPVKFALDGNDHMLNPVRELLIDPAVRIVAHRIHTQGLNSQSPDFEQQRYAPMSAATVKKAEQVVRQVLAMIGQTQLEQTADQQADLPQASLGAGPPGGRVAKDPKDMSDEEKRAEFNARMKAKAEAKGGG